MKWRRFLNYDPFMACQALHTRGNSNDKADATNTAVSFQHGHQSSSLISTALSGRAGYIGCSHGPSGIVQYTHLCWQQQHVCMWCQGFMQPLAIA